MSTRSSFASVVEISVALEPLLKLSCILSVAGDFCLQSSLWWSSAVQMRLRPIRTCSGVQCFGGFHIKRLNLFLFLRGPLT
ncbi:hypothetical protein LIER_25386 [Lithospermum erythrorhizon]|uniref:Secreted protein n=1 Tax=Lithospermum erythrorhizon TaxID=34254 RepID=A0AAV3R601_LITER